MPSRLEIMQTDATMWSLEDAVSRFPDFENLTPQQDIQKAFNASIRAGYRTGAASGTPPAFLADFFANVLLPVIAPNYAIFKAAVEDAKARLTHILATIQVEKHCGPITARLSFGAVAADAVWKVCQAANTGAFNWNTLSITDWLAMGICFHMWLSSQSSQTQLRALFETSPTA